MTAQQMIQKADNHRRIAAELLAQGRTWEASDRITAAERLEASARRIAR